MCTFYTIFILNTKAFKHKARKFYYFVEILVNKAVSQPKMSSSKGK